MTFTWQWSKFHLLVSEAAKKERRGRYGSTGVSSCSQHLSCCLLITIGSLNHYTSGCIRSTSDHWVQWKITKEQMHWGAFHAHAPLSIFWEEHVSFLVSSLPLLRAARGCGIVAGGLQSSWGDAGPPCSSAVCQRRQKVLMQAFKFSRQAP